jgi:hypothetical protein
MTAGMEISRLTMALAIGDVAGIGPQLAAKLLVDPVVRTAANLVVVGDKGGRSAAPRGPASPCGWWGSDDVDEARFVATMLDIHRRAGCAPALMHGSLLG